MLEMYRRDQFRQDLLVDRCVELAAARGAARRPRRAARRGRLARPHPALGALRVRRADLLGLEVLRSSAAARWRRRRRCPIERIMTPRRAPRLLPPLRRGLRAAAGVLPRVRRAPADEPRRRRRPRLELAAALRLVSRRLDLAGRASSSSSRSSRRRPCSTANATRTSATAGRSTAATTGVTVGPGATTSGAPPVVDEHAPDRPAADDHDRAAPDGAGHAVDDQRATTPTRRTRTPSPSGRPARAATRTSSSRCRSRAAARTPSRAPGGRSGTGLQRRRRPRLVPVLEPPPRLLRRLRRDLRDPGGGGRRPLGRPRQGLSGRLPDPRHPLAKARCKRPAVTGTRDPGRTTCVRCKGNECAHFVTTPRTCRIVFWRQGRRTVNPLLNKAFAGTS